MSINYTVYPRYKSYTSDLRPQISDLRPQISDLRPQISDLRPQTSDLRPQISDLRPQTTIYVYFCPSFLDHTYKVTGNLALLSEILLTVYNFWNIFIMQIEKDCKMVPFHKWSLNRDFKA